jgi:DNA invertase Pin-like site-specific DNA recombinase/uncharacterized protein YndB with AHSA1/START domain
MSQGKLRPFHLQRQAYVYVRQSSAAQVLEHTESRKRQYALVERAVALGWPREAVVVVDEDQGKSGASAQGRTGFARLAHAVAHGEAGALFALEVSRLARSSMDWQRLLALCAVAQVIVVDESAVYDPADADDKLLLDLKGTMSEAELHWLGLRMVGARRSKARRGELHMQVPTGYVWTETGLVMDPDEAVQRAVRLVFERFRVEPSAWAVMRWAHETGLAFPTRRPATQGAEVEWKPLGITRLIDMLHNPIYAGAYAYGRRPQSKALVDGDIRRVRAAGRTPEEWAVCQREAHPGYITWETYLENQEKLRRNVHHSKGVSPGAPREGKALLTGLLLCGRCGRRMRTNYGRASQRHWYYLCPGDRDKGEKTCWMMGGESLDAAVEKLFLDTLVPAELEVSLAVEREVSAQADGLAAQWRSRMEQARYEAHRAERRYKAVEPENRVVARTLEREWEEKLRQLQEVERHYAEARRRRHVELTSEERGRIRALARDLPAVWRAPTTRPEDKKAMLRLVVEAVCVTPVDVPRRSAQVEVQWHSGATSRLTLARPLQREKLRTPDKVVARIRKLAAAGLCDADMAERLNEEAVPTAAQKRWTVWAIRWVRQRHHIPRVAPDAPRSIPIPDRHPDGRYSLAGAAKRFGVTPTVVRGWARRGLVPASREDFGQRRGVYWLTLDEEIAARLDALTAARQSARRHNHAGRPNGGHAS